MSKVPEENKHERKSSLFEKLGLLALKKNNGNSVRETIFNFMVKDKWMVCVNGYPDAKLVAPRNCMPRNLPRYSFGIWYEGRYVGWCNPNSTIMLEEKSNINPDLVFDCEEFEKVVATEVSAHG